MRKKSKKITITLVLVLATGVLARADNRHNDHLNKPVWTTSWATANRTVKAFDAPLPKINNATLRQVVRISQGGRMIRVSFTNEQGQRPLSINEAYVAKRDRGAAILDGSGNQLTFSGATSASIPPGKRLTSDPVNMPVLANTELVISAYLPVDITGSGSPVTYHVRALQTNYIAAGNQAAAADLPHSETTTAWYFLANVDVANDCVTPAIATLGDSITDGDQRAAPNEPIDLNVRYPDLLSDAIISGGKAASVINLGISGNQVLTAFLGQSPAERLNRDLLTLSGISHVIYLEGINDIGLPVLLSVLGAPTPTNTANAIIAGHQQIIRHAKDAGLFIIGGTLTPSGGSSLPGYHDAIAEAKRQKINAWIRGSGAYDAVIDFDEALADPEKPSMMRDELTADGLHPNARGYQVMANTAFAAIHEMLPNKQYEDDDHCSANTQQQADPV
ncbi:MAG: SGNH/GDSL hydrolase family protein [Gammaproteobacteria bacterium]|nr:SGNH/GDSL hydrolase family protein [Gammaproteobacteria bacterium]MBT6586443.1 SGNH/GDSL hydrolase family protein [Gammaproteobacteria bacterium]MBT6892881.1 SGNH/GDSL hydrolase family protein [Gammaproteobacteria bacterium]MBT7878970.1 SGNH/GDSL hydrolase family protein [Gammaproteobacteria bacterium]